MDNLNANVAMIEVSKLKPHDRNARTHSKKQVVQLRQSIERFGFTNPVLIDDHQRIIAGHGRVAAAKLMGMTQVPTLTVSGLSEAERRAYIIADNRLAELAGWDNELLSLELGSILDLDPDFDLDLSGFIGGELEALLSLADPPPAKGEESIAEIDGDRDAVTAPGDIWVLGNHRLICGDSRDEQTYRRLLGHERAQMVFTDPPYNVPVDGFVCGLGKVQHREFAMASGEMDTKQFTNFLTTVMCRMASFSVDGSIHYVCMDWRHMSEILDAGVESYTELKNLVVWNKDNGGMGTFYRSKHELVFVYKNGKAPHINNFGLGEHGRYRTNVWDYPGINTLKASRDDELAMHPTVKPVLMVADAIRDCSKRNGIILDAFSGSGTTIMACEDTGRRGRAIEIDPLYCDAAIRRWQKATGLKATYGDSATTFDEVEALIS